MSDGQRVYLVDDHRDIVDLLAGGQGVFAIAQARRDLAMVAAIEASTGRG